MAEVGQVLLTLLMLIGGGTMTATSIGIIHDIRQRKERHDIPG